MNEKRQVRNKMAGGKNAPKHRESANSVTGGMPQNNDGDDEGTSDDNGGNQLSRRGRGKTRSPRNVQSSGSTRYGSRQTNLDIYMKKTETQKTNNQESEDEEDVDDPNNATITETSQITQETEHRIDEHVEEIENKTLEDRLVEKIANLLKKTQ